MELCSIEWNAETGFRGRFWLFFSGTRFASTVGMMRSKPMVSLPDRRVTAGDTRITVVEAEGKLVAIVKDRLRGTVRITLGTMQPPLQRSCCD